MNLLKVSDLSCEIQGRALLSQIQLDLQQGKLLVVLGRNGAGKSTLFKHLTKEMPVKNGQVQIFEKDLRAFKPRELAQRRAVLPQFTHLNFGYQVLDVVLLGRIPHQKGQTETARDREISLEALNQVGLLAYKDRNYLTLSGGEQQRVHLARALAQIHDTTQPTILFLDEPTSSLDISHQHQVLKIVKNFTHKGVGVFAILHDLNLASQYADKILILAEGKVRAYGKPESVLTSEILSDAFQHPIQVMDHPTHPCKLIV